MKISRFVFNMFGENTYIVYDETTREAAIIDPGMLDGQEEKAIDDFIVKNGLTLTHMIITHLHIDHTFGYGHVKSKYGLMLEGSEADNFLGSTRTAQARMFHLPLDLDDVTVDVNLKAGDEIVLGPDSRLTVINVPGHSPGSIALYSEQNGVVFTGDALFPDSIGRTDVPRGNHDQLINSIKTGLLTLPPDTVVLPGHGGETTIGREKAHNPFLR